MFCGGPNGDLSLEPIIQLVFEQLYDFGLRDFCFVVGRGKRAIEDHFAPDEEFLNLLRAKGKQKQASQLLDFYEKVKSSDIVWVNQPAPLGFGHAVLTARSVAGEGDVIVHAGDTQIISADGDHLRRMLKVKRETKAEAVLLLKEVRDPRQFGVAQVEPKQGNLVVKEVVEKPERPVGRLILMPVYLFSHSIFDALEYVKPGKGGEIQLTDGIQRLIDDGREVRAVRVKNGERWLDVGTPETYWEALGNSHESLRRK